MGSMCIYLPVLRAYHGIVCHVSNRYVPFYSPKLFRLKFWQELRINSFIWKETQSYCWTWCMTTCGQPFVGHEMLRNN